MADLNMQDVVSSVENARSQKSGDFSFASQSNSSTQAQSNSPKTKTVNPSTMTSSPLSKSAPSSSTTRTNPRSCVTCRKRKVRCNKEDPCANCVKAGIECKFPGPGAPPRKARKVPDAELLTRLKRLEGVVNSLGAHVDGDGKVTTAQPKLESMRGQIFQNTESRRSGSVGSDNTEERRNSTEPHLGRLMISDDRSRYVSNGFWAKMGDEIAEMRDLLDPPTSEDEDEDDSLANERITGHQEFIFGYSSVMEDLHDLHPSPSQIFILWEVFKENVDPVVRVLHRPTAKRLPLNAAGNMDKMSRAGEALLFAIYFGAVTSLTEKQCQDLLQASKDSLTKKYRFATEQALAKADFLNSSSLMCLQAIVLFLTSVRFADDSRFVWVMTATVVHLARALGIHRDGTHFNLNPFDTEIRRRLWWQIGLIDNRSAEDQGTDAILAEQFFDTQLPLNINDEDIYPGMKEPPTPRVGFTEMTFNLMRFEIATFTRRMNTAIPGDDAQGINKQTLAEREKIIDECSRHLEQTYLRYCDMSVPIAWVTATVARLVLGKMWLAAHHRRWGVDDKTTDITPDLRHRLFVTSVEVIEFSLLLEDNEHTSRWLWLFRSYMQWQSVVFVLSELCVLPQSPDVDRAWRAVEAIYHDREPTVPRHQRSMLWKPLRELMVRARARRKALEAGKAPANVATAFGSSNNNTPPSVNMDYNSPNGSSLSESWFFGGNQTNHVIGSTAEAFGLDLSDLAGHPQNMMDTTGYGRSNGISNPPMSSSLPTQQRNQPTFQPRQMSMPNKNQNVAPTASMSHALGHDLMNSSTPSPSSATTNNMHNMNTINNTNAMSTEGFSEMDFSDLSQPNPWGLGMIDMDPSMTPYQQYFMNVSQDWF